MSRTATRKFLGALLGGVVLAGVTAAAAPAQLPSTTDPRANLAPGMDNAGVAARGMSLLAHVNKPAAHAAGSDRAGLRHRRANSDIAFQGNYAFVGNFNGFTIYDITNPSAPTLKTVGRLPRRPGRRVGLQEPAVHVGRGDAREEGLRARRRRRPPRRASAASASSTSRNIDAPVQVGGVQTCRGSHTHTLVRPKNDPNNVYIYVSGTAGARTATTDDLRRQQHRHRRRTRTRRSGGSRSSRSRSPPRRRRRSSNSRGCSRNERPARSTACRTRPTPQHPCASARRVRRAPAHRRRDWPDADTNACHDITVYEKFDLAAGSCEGNGLLIDISDPANPSAHRRRRRPAVRLLARRDVLQRRQEGLLHRRVGRRHAARAAARPTS